MTPQPYSEFLAAKRGQLRQHGVAADPAELDDRLFEFQRDMTASSPPGEDPGRSIIGFSGSRLGMTVSQMKQLRDMLVDRFVPGAQFHHGDCIGADAEAHGIARAVGYWIVGHPPQNPALRAWCAVDEQRRPAPYLSRDDAIVAETRELLAAPDTAHERLQSGTWATVRRARKAGKPYEVITP